ncbi:MAG: glycosyltransferase family 87 protein [Dehalococcoidales bacterium]|nr:glycosyltransferase family 87 protein [Dehalococcoidales bacterium]
MVLSSYVVISLYGAVVSLFPPYVYLKDFIQEYLLARALLSGVDPYLQLPALTTLFLGPLPNLVFPHPSPHPPPVAVLCLPFALLDYRQAALLWMILQLTCLFAAFRLLAGMWYVRRGIAVAGVAALLTLGWAPVLADVLVGQMGIILLLLASLAWRELRLRKQVRAGLLIGGMLSLKLLGWPLVVLLLIRREWRASLAAVSAWLGFNGIAALLVGFDVVVRYYTEVGSAVFALYRAHERNISLWSVGWRLFDGTGSPVVAGLTAPPLFASTVLAQLVSYGLPALFSVGGLALTARTRRLDTAFSILLCVSILVSPIAWMHYLSLALLPLAVCLKHLMRRGFPRPSTYIGAAIAFSWFVAPAQLDALALRLGGGDPAQIGQVSVPLAASLVTLAPTLGLLLLIVLLWSLDRGLPPDGDEGTIVRQMDKGKPAIL